MRRRKAKLREEEPLNVKEYITEKTKKAARVDTRPQTAARDRYTPTERQYREYRKCIDQIRRLENQAARGNIVRQQAPEERNIIRQQVSERTIRQHAPERIYDVSNVPIYVFDAIIQQAVEEAMEE